jgi:hypothetical protein
MGNPAENKIYLDKSSKNSTLTFFHEMVHMCCAMEFGTVGIGAPMFIKSKHWDSIVRFIDFSSSDIYKKWTLGQYVQTFVSDLPPGEFLADMTSFEALADLTVRMFEGKSSQDKGKISKNMLVESFCDAFERIVDRNISNSSKTYVEIGIGQWIGLLGDITKITPTGFWKASTWRNLREFFKESGPLEVIERFRFKEIFKDDRESPDPNLDSPDELVCVE